MSSVLLRQIPGDTVVHRLWAGTKLVATLMISLLLMVYPAWPVLAVVAAFLLLAGLLARIPLSAVPRPPWWLWALILAGGVVNVMGGQPALLRYLQITVFGMLLFAGALIVSWTTPANEIAPAIATLASPLRPLRVPVDEWAVAIALCLRSLPLLIDELRILRAARRVRPKALGAARPGADTPLVQIITATMSVALRRAGELGEAITARAGTGQLAAYPSRPHLRDLLALVITTLTCTVALVWALA